jgi:phospholipase A1
VLGRVWRRINESASGDNNPNIVDYTDRGDVVVTYRNNGHDYSALLRRNFSTNRGAVQLSWASRWQATSRVMCSTFRATVRA